jgi:hypothetical protein
MGDSFSCAGFIRRATISNIVPKAMNAMLEKNATPRTTSYHRNAPGTQPLGGQDSGPPVRMLIMSKITPIAMSPNPRV